MAGHTPGSAWSQRTQGGFGSGGATVTPASSDISRGEHLRAAPGYTRRAAVQHLTAGPELLGVHRQRTDADHRRERPGTRKPAPGQPGLHRDTRHRPAVIGTRLDYHLRAVGQPQAEHHRDLLNLEQHGGGFATQMIQAPSRQPVRQIVQRHNQDCAIGADRTGRSGGRS